MIYAKKGFTTEISLDCVDLRSTFSTRKMKRPRTQPSWKNRVQHLTRYVATVLHSGPRLTKTQYPKRSLQIYNGHSERGTHSTLNGTSIVWQPVNLFPPGHESSLKDFGNAVFKKKGMNRAAGQWPLMLHVSITVR